MLQGICSQKRDAKVKAILHTSFYNANLLLYGIVYLYCAVLHLTLTAQEAFRMRLPETSNRDWKSAWAPDAYAIGISFNIWTYLIQHYI